MRNIKLTTLEIKVIIIALKRMKHDFDLEILLGMAGADTQQKREMRSYAEKLISEISNQVNGKSSRPKQVKEQIGE